MARQANILTRARAAWGVYKHGYPARRITNTKAAPFMWPAWVQGKPLWQIINLQSYINEGFNLNTLIYDSIMYKVRAMTSAPLRAYTGDRDSPKPLDESHPLARLVARPNPHQSWPEFHSQNIVYKNLAGNYYVWMDRPSKDVLPEAMYSFRPDRTYIVPDRGGKRGIKGYLYVPEGKSPRDGTPILPQDMMHVKMPNPGDPLEGMGYGLSPMSPLARSADVDNEITRYLKLFFERGTMQSGLVTFKDPVTPDDAAELRKKWQDVYGGVDNWGDVMVLGREGQYTRVGLTFDEMGFEGLDGRNESRIVGPFGVPPILIGTRIGLENSPWSNIEEARRIFWEDTMLPESRLDEVEYQYFLQGDDEWVKFDTSNVPALRQDIADQAKAMMDLVTSGVPPNEAAKKVGLEIQDIPSGDISYMPMNMMPVGAARALQPQAGGPSAVEDERGKA